MTQAQYQRIDRLLKETVIDLKLTVAALKIDGAYSVMRQGTDAIAALERFRFGLRRQAEPIPTGDWMTS